MFFIEVFMSYITIILPKLWDECPSWWFNLVRRSGTMEAALAEYNARAIGFNEPAPDTRVVFDTEQDYTAFLLRWS